ncbi:hypothetical protein ACFL96_10770 [Thermoproteota archaeon]
MHSWKNYKAKVKKYFKFSNKEIGSLVFTILVCAFILSFTEWGVTEFNARLGFLNFFNTALIVLVVLLVQESVHRLFALLVGYQVEYKHWTVGLVVCLVLVFFSNGSLKFLIPGGILISHLAVHRIGKFRYGPNYNTMGWIAMTGPLSNLFLAILFKVLSGVAPNEAIFLKAMNIALLFAIFNMLPIPPLNGHQLFFGSRYIYLFVIGAVVAAAAGLYYMAVVGTILAALIFGAVCIVLYFVFVDKMF